MRALDDDIHTTAALRLSGDGGQRYTSSRRAIVEVLAQSDHPLTLPQILALEPLLSQSSAYRNLAELINAGVVHRIVVADEHGHFELAEDLTGHHHHLICRSCGSVTDFVVPAPAEATIDRALASIADERDFQVEHHRLDLVGRCRECVSG